VSRARPGVLRVGDRVCLESVVRTVVGFVGTTVLLADEHGSVITPDFSLVCSRGVFEPAPHQVGRGLASGLLAGVAAPAVERARWWERHVLEVITGRNPGGAASRPEYDPQSHSMAAREAAKAAELSHDGDSVSAFTVRRKRQRYETRGLAGLVDGRSTRARPPHGRTDSRVAEELRRVIDASTDSASRTVEFFRWKVEQQLTAAHGLGEVTMPSRAAFYRLFDRVTAGRHVTGSARTRRSEAAKPDGTVTNTDAAHHRAAQWIRARCDPTYQIDPPLQPWETELT
jgi:putative transposase